MVEHAAVNRVVVGSSPTSGASSFRLDFQEVPTLTGPIENRCQRIRRNIKLTDNTFSPRTGTTAHLMIPVRVLPVCQKAAEASEKGSEFWLPTQQTRSGNQTSFRRRQAARQLSNIVTERFEVPEMLSCLPATDGLFLPFEGCPTADE